MEDFVKRRLCFLLECSLYESKRDQAVTFTMRVLSNYASVGRDVGSHKMKTLNPRMSVRAQKLLCTEGLNYFCDNTVNEHPQPLNEMWLWLTNSAKPLTPVDIWENFNAHKLVTITKAEDKLLTTMGLRSRRKATERYLTAGITVVELDCTPAEWARKVDNNLESY